MNIKKASLLINIITIISIVCAGALLFFLRLKMNESQKAANERFFSILLVDELRKSSEELTRQVRNYSVTGNLEAINAYNRVLAIRNGNEPRPLNSPVYPGEKKVLLDLLRQYGVTAEEFALVEQANALSDALVALEVESMNTVKGIFMDERGHYTVHGEPDREQAMQLVFGEAYDAEVAKIMQPIVIFEEKVFQRTDKALELAHKKQQTAKLFCYVSLAAVLALAALNLMFNSFVIVHPITRLTKLIKKLSTGHINLDIEKEGNNEIGHMRVELSKFVIGLKHAAEFAHNIGKGRFDTDYHILSDNDTLGKSLLEMRESLQNAEKKQAVRAREDEQRNWGTAGLAKFAEILRRDNDNMEALSYNVISNMVKYLDINQGGIFVISDNEKESEHFLELKACYAYDRKKFAEQQIRPGIGLVGTCYLEGEPIYLTDIPDKYINITSGLGDSNPSAIYICPLKVNEKIYGVIELASFTPFEPYQQDFIQKVSESIASTLSTVRTNIRTNLLLEQTKIQTEQMANSEEELRQNMEEMHATQEESHRREEELRQTMEQMTATKDEIQKVLDLNELKIKKLDLVMQVSKIALWENKIINGDSNNPDNPWIWSDELRHMLGFNDEHDFPNVGNSLWGRIHKEDADMINKAYERHITDRTGKTPYDVEYRIAKKNGDYILVHERAVTMREADGTPLFVLGTWKEVSD